MFKRALTLTVVAAAIATTNAYSHTAALRSCAVVCDATFTAASGGRQRRVQHVVARDTCYERCESTFDAFVPSPELAQGDDDDDWHTGGMDADPQQLLEMCTGAPTTTAPATTTESATTIDASTITTESATTNDASTITTESATTESATTNDASTISESATTDYSTELPATTIAGMDCTLDGEVIDCKNLAEALDEIAQKRRSMMCVIADLTLDVYDTIFCQRQRRAGHTADRSDCEAACQNTYDAIGDLPVPENMPTRDDKQAKVDCKSGCSIAWDAAGGMEQCVLDSCSAEKSACDSSEACSADVVAIDGDDEDPVCVESSPTFSEKACNELMYYDDDAESNKRYTDEMRAILDASAEYKALTTCIVTSCEGVAEYDLWDMCRLIPEAKADLKTAVAKAKAEMGMDSAVSAAARLLTVVVAVAVALVW